MKIQQPAKRIFELCIVLVIAVSASSAQNANRHKSTIKTDRKILDSFMDKRFGMFIHWGPVTLRGTEIGWSRGNQVTVEDYDNLYKEFDPVLFNADAWVKVAKSAGMKYVTITAKHHDGFCLWPTAFSNYNIMNSPFKRDIVGELATACKKQGIAFCIYFTVLDWHDVNYPIHNIHGDTTIDTKANIKVLVTTIKNELKELITRYHPYMLWFDGNWESPWTKAYGEEVYQHLKTLDPNVIVNNRLGKGEHTTLGIESVGDYATPEQEVGKMNMNDPWESCITICNQWAWKPNDTMKSKKECIQTLVQTAGGNGNLLLNVGPMMDGRIERRQAERLAEMGSWLKVNGVSIYNTKGGPYKPNKLFATTRKGNIIYLQVFSSDNNSLILPALKGARVVKAYFLNGQSVVFIQDDKNIHFMLPDVMPDKDCSIVVLELNKDAEDLPVIE